jgi:glyoxylase-like metal-dependent hydrolase (beta-lactamase superfamily II)
MLDELGRASKAAQSIDTVVNTHAHGDHCWGNQLVTDAELVASRACAEEMRELSPTLVARSRPWPAGAAITVPPPSRAGRRERAGW